MSRLLSVLVLGLVIAGTAHADRGMRFKAKLQGFDLFGNPVATDAKGKARLQVIDDGTAIGFRVDVKGIRNLWMAHIHVAPEPVTVTDPAGPVAFWFAPHGMNSPGDQNLAEEVDGRLSTGFIITDGQLVGPLAPDEGNPEGTGVSGLIQAITEGRASVIVHTNDFDPETPTGVAGDSPPGELRGTLE